MEFNLNEIIEATGAKLLKNNWKKETKFTFSTDTRTIKTGDIYIPLKGANFNGEDFIEQAINAGASGFFATKEKLETVSTDFDSKLILEVEDTLIAYLSLARYYRRKINPKTIAITGSSGKTTTKEMAYSVASEKFKTHKSELNFNNEIGLCKTILSMPEDTEVLILEMGMRGLGEIELLSKYSEPNITIIANVGTAHIGRLGTRENIAKAKCEIVDFMNPKGYVIAHDNELIKQELKNKKLLNEPKYFSLQDAQILKHEIGYTKFNYNGFEYELNIEGDYNVQNALAVIEMAKLLKMTNQEIANGLNNFAPIEKRWEIKEIKGFKIINDSYNANPESMQAVLKTVLDIYNDPLLLVLGNMGELGDNEAEYHSKIGEFLASNIKPNVHVATVGNLGNKISEILTKKGFYSENFNDNINMANFILDNVKFGTTIILKASRSMKFEEIIELINKE